MCSSVCQWLNVVVCGVLQIVHVCVWLYVYVRACILLHIVYLICVSECAPECSIRSSRVGAVLCVCVRVCA